MTGETTGLWVFVAGCVAAFGYLVGGLSSKRTPDGVTFSGRGRIVPALALVAMAVGLGMAITERAA